MPHETSAACPAFWSVPDVANRLGVDQHAVLGWIRRGELSAVNVARRLGGRPRWRVSSDELERFLRSRRAIPAPRPGRRPRESAAGVFFLRGMAVGRGEASRHRPGSSQVNGRRRPRKEVVKR
jgi:hypothetical protein